jgi:hypothetical protein
MRFFIALTALAVSLSLGGCCHPSQVAYAMPLPSPQLPHPIKASLVKPPPLPTRKFSRPVNATLVKSAPLSSRKVSKPTNARFVNPPPLPPKKSTQARSQMPPSGGQDASVLPPAIAKHYVVVDTVGNCAVVDAKPADGLKIIGDKDGYASLESANKALKDSKAECKDSVETGAESKFKAAQAKAEKVGVHKLTREDIEGLSNEQIKQLRGY